MPLQFDPASILAPGGIASGLDDMGSAVVNAMNRRAERRYATEAEKRRRGFQVEDREAGFGQQQLMQDRGFGHADATLDKTQSFARTSAETLAQERLDREARATEAALEQSGIFNDPRNKTAMEQVEEKVLDPTTKTEKLIKRNVERKIPVAREEVVAEVTRRRQLLEGQVSRHPQRDEILARFDAAAAEWLKEQPAPPTAAVPPPNLQVAPYQRDPVRQKRLDRLSDRIAASPQSDLSVVSPRGMWEAIKAPIPRWLMGDDMGFAGAQSYGQQVAEQNKLMEEDALAQSAHLAMEKSRIAREKATAARGRATSLTAPGGASMALTSPATLGITQFIASLPAAGRAEAEQLIEAERAAGTSDDEILALLQAN